MIAATPVPSFRWPSPVFSDRHGRVAIRVCLAVALLRAADYLTGRDGSARTPDSPLVGIERAAPLWLWGAGMLAGTVLVALGLALRRPALAAVGHLILGAAYTGLALGLVPAYVTRAWADGIRSVGELCIPAVLHAGMAVRIRTLQPLARR